MSKLFTRATVAGVTLTGANLKATLQALWDALNTGGFSDSSRATVSTTSTLATTQCGLLLIDATAGSIVLTLPASGASADDAFFDMRRIDSTANTVTVQRAGADTVNGGASTTIPANGKTEIKLPAGSINWRAFAAAGSGNNTDLTSTAIMPGYLFGCQLSTAGASTTMSVTAGKAQDSTGVQLMTLAAIAKTTASWALGTAVGGLDTGTIANTTWYHYYVIRRPDTGVVDVIFSLSATAPALPTNYTQFRRIGSGLTSALGQWQPFSQRGDEFLWSAAFIDINISNLAGTYTNFTLTTPLGVKTIAIQQGFIQNATANAQVYIFSPDTTDMVVNGNAQSIVSVANTYSPLVARVRTNTASQVRAVGSAASTTVFLSTIGYIDSRGRDA